MGSYPQPGSWFVVVPVKSLSAAKTRLGLPPRLRADMAAAMALDTVSAATGCPRVAAVVVVSDGPATKFAATGATVVPDVPGAGLNAALAYGASAVAGALAAGESPASGGVAALTADLPALRPAELANALERIPCDSRAVVADAAGAGTTLLAAAAGRSLQPEFGVSSYRRHLGGGAFDLTAAAGPGLRCDVDTAADLCAAIDLGVGRRTAALLPHLAPWPYAVPVQATVRGYSAQTRSGDVLLDDGSLLPFDSDAFDRSGLRLLRLGQRVRILLAGEGSDQRVVFLTLATFPIDAASE